MVRKGGKQSKRKSTASEESTPVPAINKGAEIEDTSTSLSKDVIVVQHSPTDDAFQKLLPFADVNPLTPHHVRELNKQIDLLRIRAETERIATISTDIAETGVTVQGVRYIIDTGYVQRPVYSRRTGE